MKTTSLFGIVLSLFIVSNAIGQQTNYDVTPGNGNGVRFWTDNAYKVHMGSGTEYSYGPVTSYSIKMNMNNEVGRGWTWGNSGAVPIAALNNLGNMQIAGSFTSAKLNILGIGSMVNAGNSSPESGDLIVKSYTGGRSTTSGAQLEFVIPANSDGTNMWGQGRIITVAGTTNSGDASGKMILGTRRYFNKVSTGIQWYYGDDLTIDAAGNIGIGTVLPRSPLEVRVNGDNNTVQTGLIIQQTNPTNPNNSAGVSLDFGIGNNSSNNNIEGKITLKETYWGTRPKMLFSLWDANNVMQDRMVVDSDGNVGVGTISPDSKLAVKGTVHAQEVKVDLNVPGPDYVFEENYNLPSLTEIENYINQHKHLPEAPSAKEMETNGINLSEMNMLLLKKVEELTLHLIELKKEIEVLKSRTN